MFRRYLTERVRRSGLDDISMTGRASLSELRSRDEALGTLIRALLEEDTPRPA